MPPPASASPESDTAPGPIAKATKGGLFGARIWRGTMLLTGSRMAGYALSFVRNIMLARMLTKADFGVSAAFATAVGLFELANRCGLNQMIIQSKSGNARRLMASLHTVQLILGIVSGTLLLAFGGTMARVFKVPELGWAFAVLGVVPVLNALCHLDSARFQRTLRFFPSAMAEIIPQIIATICAWPAVAIFKDCRAIICVLVIKALATSLVTHWYAIRRFEISWDTVVAKRILEWGWPLFLSGLVFFFGRQADQMVIAAAFSVSELADYSIAASLVSVPGFVIGSVAVSIGLPILSRTQNDPAKFSARLNTLFTVATILAVFIFVPFALCGQHVVKALYGLRYGDCGPYITILGGALALRIVGMVGTLATVARGDTQSDLYAGLWRCASLPLAGLVVWAGTSPVLVASSVVLGESAALLFAILRLRGHVALSGRYLTVGAAVILFTLAASCILLSGGGASWVFPLQFLMVVIVCGIAIAIALLALPEQRNLLYVFGKGKAAS